MGHRRKDGDMDDDFAPETLEELEEMCFGRDGEERNGYDAVWIDHFWNHRIDGMVFAADIDEAIERGLAGDADGLPIDSLDGPDGQATNLSGGHQVRAVRVLIDTDSGLIEETIGALTWQMAMDLAHLMFGSTSEVLGIQEGGDSLWMSEPDDEFFDRTDLPVGWSYPRPRR
jgi:hypothetical protein